MKRSEISIIVAIISIIAFFWLIGYHSYYVTKANRERVELKGRISDLEISLKEKEETIGSLAERIKAVETEIAQTNQRLREAEVEIASLEMDKQSMRVEIAGLKRNRDILETRARRLTEEKRMLEAKLNSLVELKKAMQVVKTNQRNQKILALKENDQKRLALGNRGFIIKDRQFTMLKKLSIDVIPADVPKSEK